MWRRIRGCGGSTRGVGRGLRRSAGRAPRCRSRRPRRTRRAGLGSCPRRTTASRSYPIRPPHRSTETTTAASRSDLDRTHHAGLGRAPDGRPESSKTQAGHLCGQTHIPTSRVGLDSTNTPAQDVVQTMSRHRRRPRQATPRPGRPDSPTRAFSAAPMRSQTTSLLRHQRRSGGSTKATQIRWRDTSGRRECMALKTTVRPASRTTVTDTAQRATTVASRPKGHPKIDRRSGPQSDPHNGRSRPDYGSTSARAGPYHGATDGADSSRARARDKHRVERTSREPCGQAAPLST